MRARFFIMMLVVVSFGCATQHESPVKEVTISIQEPEKTIYERLRTEPIPLPATTPFDSDPKQREAYIEGFNEVWNWVISGAAIHGDRAFIRPIEQEESWRAGWKYGYKIASDRWMQEFEKWRKESASQTNSPP